MTCEEFLRRLDQGEPALAEEAAAHAAACPACARALARSRAMESELRAMADEPAPPFLHARIMAHVRSAQRSQVRSRRLAFAAVAAVVLALGSYALLWRGQPPTPTRVAERLAAPSQDKGRRVSDMREGQEGAVGGVLAPAPPPKVSMDKAAAPQAIRRKEAPAPAIAAAPVTGGTLAQAPAAEHVAEEKKVEMAAERAPAVQAQQGVARAAADEAKPAAAAKGEHADALGAAAAGAPAPVVVLRQSGGPLVQAKAVPTAAEGEAAAPETTACVLRNAAGEVVAHFALATTLAPPARAAWTVEVARDGTLAVHDDRGRVFLLAAVQLRSALGPLRLPPGRYALLPER
jgi:hypothetical protein